MKCYIYTVYRKSSKWLPWLVLPSPQEVWADFGCKIPDFGDPCKNILPKISSQNGQVSWEPLLTVLCFSNRNPRGLGRFWLQNSWLWRSLQKCFVKNQLTKWSSQLRAFANGSLFFKQKPKRFGQILVAKFLTLEILAKMFCEKSAHKMIKSVESLGNRFFVFKQNFKRFGQILVAKFLTLEILAKITRSSFFLVFLGFLRFEIRGSAGKYSN